MNETKEWRHKAHAAFDEAVKHLPKKERYRKLQEVMGMSEKDAHIARFDVAQCQWLIATLRKLKEIKP